jgi:AraC family transcriptional regulator of arabinose operon
MDARIQVVLAVMKNGLDRNRSVDEAACFVNLSPSRLRHLFTLETGISPARYLRMLRMEQAKDLLESTSLSILEIVLRVGLQDRSHFEREFKNLYGLTPAQHRARVRFPMLAEAIGSIATSAISQQEWTQNSEARHKKSVVSRNTLQ